MAGISPIKLLFVAGLIAGVVTPIGLAASCDLQFDTAPPGERWERVNRILA